MTQRKRIEARRSPVSSLAGARATLTTSVPLIRCAGCGGIPMYFMSFRGVSSLRCQCPELIAPIPRGGRKGR